MKTALNFAGSNGHLEIVKSLIQGSAAVDLKNKVINNTEWVSLNDVIEVYSCMVSV